MAVTRQRLMKLLHYEPETGVFTWRTSTSNRVKVGAHFHSQSQRWRARIGYKGRQISLGLHDTPQQAHAAYQEMACQLYGEFAVCNIGGP